MKTSYRPEIDGLRAIAVLPVVLFHAGIETFSGGFVGVDVFFVISGYLITGIILREIKPNEFSLARFYERRLRRIVPALLLVLLVSLAVAPFVALPSQFEDAGMSSIAAILSVSNFYFWNQSGYFAPSAELMPFLHTWSLGVEEQFYVLFPIMLVLLHRLNISIRAALSIALVPLLALSIYLSYERPSIAFYLLPARAWELALGAAVAANVPSSSSRWAREMLSGLGFVFVIGSIFLIDTQMIFPGWVALFPCVGAALVLRYAQDGVALQQLLSWRPVVFIGLISYSLYLWHWPVIVFLRMRGASVHLSDWQSILTIGLSLTLATATWRYIETPFRDPTALPLPKVGMVLAAAGAVVMGAGIAVIMQAGFPGRLSAEATRLLAASNDIDPMRATCARFADKGRSGECGFGKDGPASFAIVGDSHAAAIRPAFELIKPFSGEAGTLWWRGACPLLVGARSVPRSDTTECDAFKSRAMEALASSPEITHVILGGRWVRLLTGFAPEVGGSYRVELVDDQSTAPSPTETIKVFERSAVRTVDKLLDMGKRVIIVGNVPEPGFDVPKMLALASFAGQPSPMVEGSDEGHVLADRIWEEIAATRPNVKYLTTWDIFCRHQCALTANGLPLYSDDDHLTARAAQKIVAPALQRKLSN